MHWGPWELGKAGTMQGVLLMEEAEERGEKLADEGWGRHAWIGMG